MQKNIASLVLIFVILAHPVCAQEKDSTKTPTHFSGSISVTNNGISLVPTFSLGKPAALFNLSVGKGRLSFEPDMRFALEGKPWSFLFWWRYKLVQSDQFRVILGAHPALNFRTMRLPVNGDSTDVTVTRRFLAGEFSPNYLLSKKVSIGIYYLYSRGFDILVPKNSHFVTLNGNFSDIGIFENFYIKFSPQFYYLKQDKNDGSFFSASVSIAKRRFPFSVSAIINKTLGGNIAGAKDFVWNTSLVYSFSKVYTQK